MKKGILIFLLMFIASWSSLKAQGAGTQYIMCIDNGMSDVDLKEVKLSASKLAERLMSCNPNNRYAVVHYGNAIYNTSNSSYTPRIYIEDDFDSTSSWPEQYFKRKFEGASQFHESLELIGNALDGINNADIISPNKILTRNSSLRLVVILFTKSARNLGNQQNGSYLVNYSDTALNTPGAFKNVTNFKVNRDAKFVVIHKSPDNQSTAAAAAIASAGGAYSGSVEDNIADPEYGILPRLYSPRTYSFVYGLSGDLEQIVNDICDSSGWGKARFYYEPADCGIQNYGLEIYVELTVPPGAILHGNKLVTRDIATGLDYSANFNPSINGNVFYQNLQLSDLNLPAGATGKYKFLLSFQYEIAGTMHQVDTWNYYSMFEYDLNLVCLKMSSPLASNEVIKSSMKVTPNPTDGPFTIILDKEIGSGKLEVLDLMGNIVYTKNIVKGKIVDADLNVQRQGTYILKVTSDKNETFIGKIIKK